MLGEVSKHLFCRKHLKEQALKQNKMKNLNANLQILEEKVIKTLQLKMPNKE